MTDEEFISGFLAVFETKPEVFEQAGAVDDLANLSNTISQIADKSNNEVADALGDWCANYPKITDEINKIERKLEPQPTKKEAQEPKLSNRYPELPESLKKRLPNSQPPRQ
jgi:2-oxo-4-hydroxy-4-carboxy--5-ureidoimidazoline (OHCU) decarboxylase